MKLREEDETARRRRRGPAEIFEELGLHVWFRYEKYREEFSHDDVIVAIDETPVGVFVEIEGCEQGIETAAAALGRSQADYILDSYRSLFLQHRDSARPDHSDMVFDTDAALLRGPSRAIDGALRALILAAGLGTRLRPLTSVRAKAAVPVNGIPLVTAGHRVAGLRGLDDLVVNLHHHPASIAAAGRRRPRSRRPRALLVGASGARIRRRSPACAAAADDGQAPSGDGSFLMVNGDTLTDVRVPAFAAAHRRFGSARHDGADSRTRGRMSTAAFASRTGGFAASRDRGPASRATTSSACRRPDARAFADLEDGVPAESVIGLYPRLIAENARVDARLHRRRAVQRHRHPGRLLANVAAARRRGRRRLVGSRAVTDRSDGDGGAHRRLGRRHDRQRTARSRSASSATASDVPAGSRATERTALVPYAGQPVRPDERVEGALLLRTLLKGAIAASASDARLRPFIQYYTVTW